MGDVMRATREQARDIAVRPSPKLPRVKRIEQLARRAEELQVPTPWISDPQLVEAIDLIAEMAREMHRMAYALDGVV